MNNKNLVDDSAIFIKSVQGIDYVRPPTLDFLKIKDTDDYVEYKIITKKNAKKKAEPKRGCRQLHREGKSS